MDLLCFWLVIWDRVWGTRAILKCARAFCRTISAPMVLLSRRESRFFIQKWSCCVFWVFVSIENL